MGQGTLDPGLGGVPGSATPAGGLHGYLREDLAGNNFHLRQHREGAARHRRPGSRPCRRDHRQRRPGSEVPKTTYTSQKLSGPGFYVLILNAGDLSRA